MELGIRNPGIISPGGMVLGILNGRMVKLSVTVGKFPLMRSQISWRCLKKRSEIKLKTSFFQMKARSNIKT